MTAAILGRILSPVVNAQRFRAVSLTLAFGSTILYWFVYVDNQRVTTERQTAQAAIALPIPLNGFRPSFRGVAFASESSRQTEVAEQSGPRLVIVVSDTCPGCAVVVPQWLDWIRSSPNHRYSAVVVSIKGTDYLSQIADAFASRGVDAAALQVTQSQEFTLSSGVSVTPTLLALDYRGYVRFVSGMFSPATQRALDEFLVSEENSSVQ